MGAGAPARVAGTGEGKPHQGEAEASEVGAVEYYRLDDEGEQDEASLDAWWTGASGAAGQEHIDPEELVLEEEEVVPCSGMAWADIGLDEVPSFGLGAADADVVTFGAFRVDSALGQARSTCHFGLVCAVVQARGTWPSRRKKLGAVASHGSVALCAVPSCLVSSSLGGKAKAKDQLDQYMVAINEVVAPSVMVQIALYVSSTKAEQLQRGAECWQWVMSHREAGEGKDNDFKDEDPSGGGD